MPRIIVVGAGSAGCVVAARLSERPEHEVLLLESGPDRSGTPAAAALSSWNWLDAMGVAEAFHVDLQARRRDRDLPRLYHRGFGLGGSGAVNAMLALPGLPADYDRWCEDHGLTEWSWDEVRPWFDALKVDLRASTAAQLTPVDLALVRSAEQFSLPSDVDTYTPADGGGALWRNADDHSRHSSLEHYLLPALGRPNLTVRVDSPVDRLLLDERRARGVALRDGTELEADHVVLCAGAIATPAILLRTGGQRSAVGQGLQDHPAASVFLALKPEHRVSDASQACIGAVLRLSSSVGEGDVHLLPLHGALGDTARPHHAIVMAAVMRVTSTGEVRLDPDDPSGPPLVDERMLTTDHDRTAMRDAARLLVRVLASAPFADIVEEVFIDTSGTPLTTLNDEEGYERWIDAALGDYFHAVGTARMGHHDDPGAVVDQSGRLHDHERVHVIDASIMPEVPSANTHLPAVMVAERLSARLLSTLDGAAASTGAGAAPSHHEGAE